MVDARRAMAESGVRGAGRRCAACGGAGRRPTSAVAPAMGPRFLGMGELAGELACPKTSEGVVKWMET